MGMKIFAGLDPAIAPGALRRLGAADLNRKGRGPEAALVDLAGSL
jgi:hypothetical protein